MADTKISGLPASTVPLAGTEVLPIVQSSTTKQVSIANVTAGRAVSALSVTATADTTPSSSLGAFNYGTLSYADVNHLATFQTTINNYAQVEIQNSNAGAAASADMIVTNNNATASTYYGDFGMNSSGWVGTAPFNSPNNVYLTSTTADLAIGTTTANNILFGINGVEYSRISSIGNELIGSSVDQGTGVLQVTGQSTFNGAVIDKTLIMAGGNNLITYSNTFSNAVWGVNTGTVTSSQADPFGGTAAWTLADVSASVAQQLSITTATLTPGIYTLSIYIKKTSVATVFPTLRCVAGTDYFCTLNTNTGVAGQNAGTSVVTTQGNFWKLAFTITVATAIATSPIFYYAVNTTAPTGPTTLDGTLTGSQVAYNFQMEPGAIATAPTLTTTTAIATVNNINLANAGIIFNGNSTLISDAANILAQRNGATAQTNRLYGTYTDASNGEWLQADWSTTANVATILTKANGTGTVRNLVLQGGTNTKLTIGGAYAMTLAAGSASIQNASIVGAGDVVIQGLPPAGAYGVFEGYGGLGTALSSSGNIVFAPSRTIKMRLFSSGGLTLSGSTDPGAGVLLTGGFTVATLPTGVTGARTYVTDALAPTFGSAVVGSGAVTIPVFYNGAAWIVG